MISRLIVLLSNRAWRNRLDVVNLVTLRRRVSWMMLCRWSRLLLEVTVLCALMRRCGRGDLWLLMMGCRRIGRITLLLLVLRFRCDWLVVLRLVFD